MADPIPTRATVSPRITTVIVLYKRRVEESEAFLSYREVLSADAELARHFALLLYDNSPEAQIIPEAGPLELAYMHDPANGGLAPAYNQALRTAERAGHEWLLLMDQDTTLTREFFCELVDWAQRLASDSQVAAIVPKLRSKRSDIYSPETPFLYQMRHQIGKRRHTVDVTVEGVQRGPLNAFNSGATLRVAALQAIGGFPPEYWLDYLDHAVFQALNQRGYRTCVMRAALEQNLSVTDINSLPIWRHRNLLAAQSLFVVQNGSLADRLAYRVYLLRVTKYVAIQCRDKRVALETFLQALLLRRLHSSPPR